MKSVGQILKEARLKKRRTRREVANATRIRESFIEAIEKGNWAALPEFPIVNGFVKAIASYLGLAPSDAVAFLRRDYPASAPVLTPKNPKKEFRWGPRLTFIFGVLIIFLVIIGYLGFQYKKFVSPPNLIVTAPLDGAIIKDSPITVIGKTDSDATLTINNQPALTNSNGEFRVDLPISKTTSEIIVSAKSRSGKETVIHRKITPDL